MKEPCTYGANVATTVGYRGFKVLSVSKYDIISTLSKQFL